MEKTTGEVAAREPLTTAAYVLRLMEPRLVTDAWCSWLSDHMLMRQINAQPTHVNKAQLHSYLTAMAAQKIGVVGMFRKFDGAHAGIYEVRTDAVHRLANLSVLIDFRRHDFDTVFRETEPVLLRNLKALTKVEKAAIVAPSSFTRLLAALPRCGWQQEGLLRAEFTSINKQIQRLDGHCFGKLLV